MELRTAAFWAHRGRLFAVAYRMLGSATEAEDVVQAAYLRWDRAEEVRDPEAFLVRVVTRLCLASRSYGMALPTADDRVRGGVDEDVDRVRAALDAGVRGRFAIALTAKGSLIEART